MIKFSEYIAEGGNVFAGTDKIPKAFINPTVEAYFEELKKIFPKWAKVFNLKTFQPLGSVGKKDFSGDIDLAVDSKSLVTDPKFGKEFLASWKIKEPDFKKALEGITARSKTATLEMNKYRAFLVCLAAVLDKASDVIQVNQKKITSGNMFTMFPQVTDKGKRLKIGVQIDWMVGNLNWLTFSYYSDVYAGNVKGLHRTQLMLATFSAAGKTFDHVNGVKDKVTQKIEASNPDAAIKVLNKLYGFKIDDAILSNYFSLYEFLDKNLSKEDFNKIKDIYLKILDSTRCDIPDNLQDYWIKNQKRLGLKGAFLPDDSNLIKYQKA